MLVGSAEFGPTSCGGRRFLYGTDGALESSDSGGRNRSAWVPGTSAPYVASALGGSTTSAPGSSRPEEQEGDPMNQSTGKARNPEQEQET